MTNEKCFYARDDNDIPYVQRGSYVLQLDLSDLSETFKERAKNELRETPENVEKGLRDLRMLILGEPNLDLPLEEEDFLKKFLRPCKFYPESTFRLMKRYYKFMYKYPQYGKDLMPSTVKKVYEQSLLEFLPIRYKGSRIMVIKIKNWNPREVEFYLFAKAVIMAVEIGMIEPTTQVGGVHVILDLEELSLSHILQMSSMVSKHIMDFVQGCVPIRLKGIHVVKQSSLFNMVYAIFKPLMGEKFKRRFFIHDKKLESLKSHIEPDFLPTYYGGSMDLPDVSGSLMVKMLEDYEDDFKKLGGIGYTNK